MHIIKLLQTWLIETEGLELRYVFGSVGLFVCKHYSKSYEWVAMTFYGGSRGGKKKSDWSLGGIWVFLDE